MKAEYSEAKNIEVDGEVHADRRGTSFLVKWTVRLLLVVLLSPLAAPAQEVAPQNLPTESGQGTSAIYPSELDDQSLDLEEFQLRLVPLTAPELAALAESWQAAARGAAQDVVDVSLEIRNAEPNEVPKLREKRLEMLDKRTAVFEKLSAVISGFEAKGGAAEEAAAMRGYLEAVVAASKSQLTFQEFSDGLLKWLTSPDGGVGVGTRLAIIAASFFGLFLVARIIRGWARRAFVRVPQLSKLLRGFLVMVVYWLTIAFGLMVVLAALGVDITPLFALVGGASFIVAFALQETLGNLAAGLMIMINRPFDEGDFVKIAGLGGKVKHVSVVSTTVATPDNQVIVIPNSKVWGDVITNVTASDKRRVDLVFGISYRDSIEKAQGILEEITANHPLVLDDPEPVIKVHELADSSVNFVVRPWVVTENYWDTYWDFQRKVKEAFDANGVSIPFPQRDLHVHVADSDEGDSGKPRNRRRQ